MNDANSKETTLADWKQTVAVFAAIGNFGLAFYASMPTGTAFAVGVAISRAIFVPLLIAGLFQVRKPFRNRNSRYNIFLIASIFVALVSLGKIIAPADSTDISRQEDTSPQELVSASLPNLNKNVPATLDNGMRIERYEAEGEKLVGNFTIVDSDKMDIKSDFWPYYLSQIKVLACEEPSYRRMLVDGVIFEYRFRDKEGNVVATVQTSLLDCM